MSKFFSFVKGWFGYPNSEKYGITALLIVLVFIIILPSFFPKNKISEENTEKLRTEMDVFIAEMDKYATDKPVFYFNPNTADSAILVQLGFSPKQSLSIINYRENYGNFYSKEAFGRLYVVSDKMYKRLYNYIDIDGDGEKQAAISTESIIELNSADTDELTKLNGIGIHYAQQIVEYRNKLGGFYNTKQLMEVKGIGVARYSSIYNKISVDTALIKRIKINLISEFDLSFHPYINNQTAKKIIECRHSKGTLSSADEFTDILSVKQIEKISPYMEF